MLAAWLILGGCAGYKGGWESFAYVGDQPPVIDGAGMDSKRARTPAQIDVPGLKLQVTIDNQLQTYDKQVYLYALPIAIDPRDTHPKNHHPGKTRVYVTVTPQVPGFVFRPSAAVLHVGDKRFKSEAGFEFAMWDSEWNRVTHGGKWEHRAIGEELVLADVGRRYLLSIDFPTPVPSPRLHGIALDLSEALASKSHPALPTIRFAPVRWNEGYT